MALMSSRVSLSTAEFRPNRGACRAHVADLQRRRSEASAGGPERAQRLHKQRKQMLPREWVAALLHSGSPAPNDAGTHFFEVLRFLRYLSARSESSGELRAAMTRMILKVNVKSGDAVKAGDVVAVLESMKMEMRICAQADGVVASTHCTQGQTVERNAVVLRSGRAA